VQDYGAMRPSSKSEAAGRKSGFDTQVLGELISILKPHTRGLRRWSVMRAMRERRSRHSGEITPKFEHEVERVFRRYCVGEATLSACPTETAPFFRPSDTAGEVWALHLERAEALLSARAICQP
jgi:hypothetical protein